jgi:dynein light chain LC8-type
MAQDRRTVIKNVDMSDEMQIDAIDIATQALDRFNIEEDIAAYVKTEFDKMYNPTWHCVVGRSFGSFVTHETKPFFDFYIGQFTFQLWKCG